jgi:hypothetical protein
MGAAVRVSARSLADDHQQAAGGSLDGQQVGQLVSSQQQGAAVSRWSAGQQVGDLGGVSWLSLARPRSASADTHATGTPWAYIHPAVWRSVPRLLQQQSAFISKLGKVIISKLAISVGATKSINLPTIVKNKQLFFSFYGVRSSVLTFQSFVFNLIDVSV